MNYKFSEREIEDILLANLETIEPGLRLLSRQYNFAQKGRIDLLCLDCRKNLVIIEIKTYARPGSVYQMEKYPTLLDKRFPNYKKPYRKILFYLKASYMTRNLCFLNNIIPFPLKYSALIIAKKNLEKTLKDNSEYFLELTYSAYCLHKTLKYF